MKKGMKIQNKATKEPTPRQKKLALSLTSAATVVAATLLRVFSGSAHLRLLSSAIAFLCFAIVYAIFRPKQKISFSASPKKPALGAILTLSAALLLSLPLLILGDTLSVAISYTPYNPFLLETPPSFLLLLLTNTLLPLLLFEIACRKFCLSCLPELSGNHTATVFSPLPASLFCGGLFALWQGEALRLPAFMLLSAALTFVAIKLASFRLTLVFSLVMGIFLQIYEAYIASFGITSSLPAVSQVMGMLLIFTGAAIPAWIFGGCLLAEKPRPRGRTLWIPLLISGILLISGSAVTGYAG